MLGATLFLGYCCDFLDSTYLRILKDYFTAANEFCGMIGEKLPEDRDLPNDKYKDKILRGLDCAVIECMHADMLLETENDLRFSGMQKNKVFDSVRGVFTEGGPVFEGAGIL